MYMLKSTGNTEREGDSVIWSIFLLRLYVWSSIYYTFSFSSSLMIPWLSQSQSFCLLKFSVKKCSVINHIPLFNLSKLNPSFLSFVIVAFVVLYNFLQWKCSSKRHNFDHTCIINTKRLILMWVLMSGRWHTKMHYSFRQIRVGSSIPFEYWRISFLQLMGGSGVLVECGLLPNVKWRVIGQKKKLVGKLLSSLFQA